MNELTMIKDYKHNPQLRRSMNALAEQTFHIDFERWYEAGCWGDQIVFHSFVNKSGDVIANVTASRIELFINGHAKKALQLGTVMTRPDYRGRGLSQSLINAVLDEYGESCELMYLFANRRVLDYYPRFGFCPLAECRYELEVSDDSAGFSAAVPPEGWRKLIPAQDSRDLALIRRLAESRCPGSRVLSAPGAASLLLWYALNGLRDCFYYNSELDALAVLEREKEALQLYDIIAADEAAMQRAFRRIPLQGAQRIAFHFTPDLLNVCTELLQAPADTDTVLFVRGNAQPLTEGGFLYPATAQA